MAQPTFQIVMKAGPKPGQIFNLDKPEMIVGREAGVDIVISDAEVSRKHARFYLVSGGYTIEDLGSTNGTFVGGQRLIGPHALLSGETVMFGEHVTLVFEVIGGNYDPMATMMSSNPLQSAPEATVSFPAGSGVPVPPEPAPVPAYEPAPVPAYEPAQPAYVGLVPPGPAPEEDVPVPAVPKKKTSNKNMLLAGCGCLLLLVCCLVVAGVVYSGATCGGPFTFIFNMVGTCP